MFSLYFGDLKSYLAPPKFLWELQLEIDMTIALYHTLI